MRQALLAGLALLWWAGAALGQTEARAVPDVPAGEASIRGTVVHGDPATVADADMSGLTVALYALGEDGRAGLRETETDADGAFRFDGVSNAPDLAYVVGTRYRGVPFGERAAFAPDSPELELVIRVEEPVTSAHALEMGETELRIDWIGGALAVQQLHRVKNGGSGVVYVAPEDRDTVPAPFETELPEGATQFTPALGAFAGSFEERGRRLFYWGPFYPGDQEVSFLYRLPVTGDPKGEEVPLRVAFPAGATRLTVLVPDSGLEADLPGADAGDPVERDGQRYRVYEARDLPPGWRLDGVIHIPQTRRDIAALREPRADLWVEFDDTALVVSEEHHLHVEGSSRLVGTPEAPLLRYELPEGARFLGLSQGAGALGIGAAPDGGLEVLGPLPPGASTFGFRYRLPVDGAAGARLARRFPLEVGVLNLLVADSGVVLDDVRLHRRRPFRSGTRHYLHREGFRIEPTETVTVGFSHLERSAFGRRTSLAIVLAAAVAGAFFLAAPLGWTSRDAASARSEPPESLQSRERESIVESLRDLEHDFETGKVAEADYQGMRGELRSRALELMREEREARRAGANASTAEPDTQLASAKHDRAGGEQSSKGIVARCPECQGTVRDSWTYCAQCGATLPAEGGAADA